MRIKLEQRDGRWFRVTQDMAGRAGTPGEVASLVAFLCSDAAGYISGQVIGINGAMA